SSPEASGRRQEDAEGGAAAGAVLDPGPAAVELGEAGDEGQADADTGGPLGLGALAEGLEDRLLHVGGHTRARVGDRDRGPALGRLDADPYGCAGLGVAQRVDHE